MRAAKMIRIFSIYKIKPGFLTRIMGFMGLAGLKCAGSDNCPHVRDGLSTHQQGEGCE